MLDIGASSSPDPKCYFTSTQLPQKIEDKQLPAKRPPFSTIKSHAFTHTIHVLSPTHYGPSAQQKEQRLQSALQHHRYAKVHLKPAELLRGEFFNRYIKAGNILLRSEGRQGIDNLLSLHEGILRIELDKLTYERAGLQGKPITSPGRKHVKQRFLIELNLRLPSMVRGRPLFNRLVYAFDTALTDTLTFLFYDLQDPTLAHAAPNPDPDPTPSTKPLPHLPETGTNATPKDPKPADSNPSPKSPIAAHAPFLRPLTLTRKDYPATRTPRLPPITAQQDETEATELLEWLHLAIEGSPRLADADAMDPFLSRYAVPNFAHRGQSASDASDSVGPRWELDADGEGEGESESELLLQESGSGERMEIDGPARVAPASPAGPATATAATTVTDLAVFEIRAFVPSSLVTKLFTTLLKTAHGEWFAMRVQAFDTSSSYTLLVKDRRCMIWQCD